jgi:hypothetical protein
MDLLGAVAQTFKEAFCSYFELHPEAYEKEVIRRSLRGRARRLWPLLEITGGATVFSARHLVALAGETRTRDDLVDVIDEYEKDFKPHAGFLLRRLKIGLSCKNLLDVHDLVRRAAK